MRKGYGGAQGELPTVNNNLQCGVVRVSLTQTFYDCFRTHKTPLHYGEQYTASPAPARTPRAVCLNCSQLFLRMHNSCSTVKGKRTIKFVKINFVVSVAFYSLDLQYLPVCWFSVRII